MVFTIHPDDLQALAKLGFGATHHRLRGVCGIVAGWIEIGIPEEYRARLLANLAEEQLLLLRLDQLHRASLKSLTMTEVLLDSNPEIFLAVTLKLGTPEEGREFMPQVLQPTAALALAVWLLQRNFADNNAHPLLALVDGVFTAKIDGNNLSSAPSWPSELSHFITSEEPTKLVFAPEVFAAQETLDNEI